MSPNEILFLSDNVKEVDAALAAGMEAILVDRPGNAAVSEEDRARLHVIQSLDEVDLLEHGMNDDSTLSTSELESSPGSAPEDSKDGK